MTKAEHPQNDEQMPPLDGHVLPPDDDGSGEEAERLFDQVGLPDLSGYPDHMQSMARTMLMLVCHMHARRLPGQQPVYPICAFDAYDVATRALVTEHVRARLSVEIAHVDLFGVA